MGSSGKSQVYSAVVLYKIGTVETVFRNKLFALFSPHIFYYTVKTLKHGLSTSMLKRKVNFVLKI